MRFKKRKVVSPIRTGETRGLPDMVLSVKTDPKAFAVNLEKAIDDRKIRLADINLKDAYEGLKGATLPITFADTQGRSRSIMASAFPVLCGLLMVAEINSDDDYEQVDTVGDELVTEIEDNKKTTVIGRVLAQDTDNQTVEETEDFPEIGAGEESYEIRHKRWGRRLSITKEMIEENDLPNIIERVNALNRMANIYVEKLTISRVVDQFGSAGSPVEPYVLRPRVGGGTALYSATANTPGKRSPSGTSVSSNALASTVNLDNARIRLAAMVDSLGNRIATPWTRCKLLVPDALIGMAHKLTGSELTPGTLNELNPWGPRGKFWLNKNILSTPFLDDISTTDWFFGDFRAQFRRKWKFRVEMVELGENVESYLTKRIAFQARVALDVEVGAVDYNRVVRCQA